MARLFDAYIMVDWSAASKPTTGPNSIWIGMLAKDARLKFQFSAVNPDTRIKAVTFLKDIIAKLNGRGDKVLLGFDFSLGYPSGTAAALELKTDADTPPWAAMHTFLASKMREKADNSNARFAIAAGMNYKISEGPFPFWGAPRRDQVSTLAAKKGVFGNDTLPEFRATELFLKETRTGNPKSCWQLAYTGSVGSQSLTGIPHVHDLRSKLPDARIWPFETGLVALDETALSNVKTLICEVYPSAITVTPEPGEIIDRAQVRSLAYHFSARDGVNRLGGSFAAPDSLDERKIDAILKEEGWILAK